MGKRDKSSELLLFSEKPSDLFSVERTLWSHGYEAVAGVDEAGRGPLAGPVVAGAVILGPDFDITGIDDSKKLTHNQRVFLFDRICKEAVACGIGLSDAEQIDRINILEASKEAMRLALLQLPIPSDYVLVDGNQLIRIEGRQRAIVGGDGKSASIASASILAKVTRDWIMAAYHEKWPMYGFDSNKGYPTAVHRKAVSEYGPCPIHRKTFAGVKEYC